MDATAKAMAVRKIVVKSAAPIRNCTGRIKAIIPITA